MSTQDFACSGVSTRSTPMSQRAGAIDNAGEQKTRSEAAALCDGVAYGSDEFKLVTAIADRRNPGREINWSPLNLLEMRVHVPEAGENSFAVRIDHLA